MRKSFCSAALVVCVLTAAAATAEQHYLYEPRPLAPNEQVKPDDGVLVREVVVGRGDTLSGISKRIIGRGYYYPQILLFNRISNPHLIHTGDVLRVPVKAVLDGLLLGSGDAVIGHVQAGDLGYHVTWQTLGALDVVRAARRAGFGEGSA